MTMDIALAQNIIQFSEYVKKVKQRLIQMGENKNNIYVTGSPDIDIMLSDKLPLLENVKEYYDINYENYAIYIYHPVTTELQNF